MSLGDNCYRCTQTSVINYTQEFPRLGWNELQRKNITIYWQRRISNSKRKQACQLIVNNHYHQHNAGNVLSLCILHYKNTECLSILPSVILTNIITSTPQSPFQGHAQLNLRKTSSELVQVKKFILHHCMPLKKILNKLKRGIKVLTR